MVGAVVNVGQAVSSRSGVWRGRLEGRRAKERGKEGRLLSCEDMDLEIEKERS